MREQSVSFYSEGARLAGILRSPDDDDGRRPAIVQGPGWLGLKDAKLYLPYHEALTAAGYHVLIFDYRGFGDSEGDRGLLLAAAAARGPDQRRHLPDDPRRRRPGQRGDFGSGGTGGGNAVCSRPTTGGSGPRSPRCRSPMARIGCAVCAASTSGTSSSPPRSRPSDPRRPPGRARWSTPARRSWCRRPNARPPTSRATSTHASRAPCRLRCAEAILALQADRRGPPGESGRSARHRCRRTTPSRRPTTPSTSSSEPEHRRS